MTSRKPTVRDLDSFRNLLVGMRGMLTGDISNLHEEAFGINGEKASVDVEADSGSDSFYQEFNLELLERDENALREIDEAIKRIGEGNFGRCESCESWIARERLRAVPYARNCVDCQRGLERNG